MTGVTMKRTEEKIKDELAALEATLSKLERREAAAVRRHLRELSELLEIWAGEHNMPRWPDSVRWVS